MSIKRIHRGCRLTDAEVAKDDSTRAAVATELPDLIARHHRRMASFDQIQTMVEQLKAAREAKGFSLADISECTSLDCSAISELETGQIANPTIGTLVRYADAVGKRLVVSLADG